MRIALDAMGGDRAPAAPVKGAVDALREFADVEIVLVGVPEVVEAELARHQPTDAERARLDIAPADHVCGMGDDPVRTVRAHAGNSARRAAELLRAGDVDGVVNMGSTGAAVAAAQLYLGRLAGVRRPGIAVPFPRKKGFTFVIDGGANPEARPEDLHQFAVMACLYAKGAMGVAEPRVGILSIGEEEHKGNQLVKETWEVFRRHRVARFVGNVEPRELFADRADVVVSDGFSGNLILKAVEGMAEYILQGVLELHPDPDQARRLAAQLAARVDYAEYGGAPLLGVKGAYLIGHGRSDARAFVNGVKTVRSCVLHHVAEDTVRELARTAQGEGA